MSAYDDLVREVGLHAGEKTIRSMARHMITEYGGDPAVWTRRIRELVAGGALERRLNPNARRRANTLRLWVGGTPVEVALARTPTRVPASAVAKATPHTSPRAAAVAAERAERERIERDWYDLPLAERIHLDIGRVRREANKRRKPRVGSARLGARHPGDPARRGEDGFPLHPLM